METKVKKGQGFSSRIGLLLTLIGAAIGAGNFWRFPRVVTLNGGGAFLIAYAVIFFCFAIPIMVRTCNRQIYKTWIARRFQRLCQ